MSRLVPVGTLLFFMLGAAAQASTVTIDKTIDLNALSPGSSLTDIFEPLSVAQTIQTGDSVHYIVNFANNEALNLTATSSNAFFDFWLAHNTGSASFTINTINLTLNGLQTNGSFANGVVAGSQSSGSAHIGPGIVLGLNTGQSISFTGFDLTYNVVNLTSPELFTDAWLIPINATPTITTVAVPGPIVGAGLPGAIIAFGGLLGFLAYRRKSAPRFA